MYQVQNAEDEITHKLTNDSSADVFGFCLRSTDVEADWFTDWDRTQSFTPARDAAYVDDKERKWTRCTHTFDAD